MIDEPVPGRPSVTLDDELVAALGTAVRVLEEHGAAARASAEASGGVAPEVELYRQAAERLRALLPG